MPITYSVSVSERMVRVSGSGCLSTDEFQEYFRASRVDPAVSPDMSRRVDFRGVTDFPATEDIRSTIRTLIASGSLPQARVAVIVDTDLAAGVSMMFAGLSGLSDRMHAFKDEASADAWLRSGDLP